MSKDGGQAFPASSEWGSNDQLIYSGHGGMSLRDYFAAKAMHAELNTAGGHAGEARALAAAAIKVGRTVEQQIAFNAYELADAMLAEREK